MAAKDAVGQYGERVAVRRLTAAGMVVLERNWRCRQGEIDVLARDGDDLVVCEVKTRRSVSAGSALEAVTPDKLDRLRTLAGIWLAAHPEVGQVTVRFDVVGVTPADRGPAVVEHLRGVA